MSQSPAKEKKKPQPLDREQIDMAKEIIKENHPLNSTKPHVAFPILKPCGSCFDKKVDQAKKEPLLSKSTTSVGKKKNMNITEEEKNQDPFLLLGFGMIAYRDLLQTFIVLFFVLSLLMAPALYFYRYGGASGYGDAPSWKTGFTLGNFGYSSVQCSTIPNSIDALSVSCAYGSISKIIDFGVNPSNIKRSDTCMRSDTNDICTQSLLNEYRSTLETECVGTGHCELDIHNNRTLKLDADAKCLSEDATFFVQFQCSQSKEILDEKYKQGCLISCLGIFMCALFMTVIYYLRKNSKIKQLEWDVATITAGDYTVEFKISKESHEHWYNTIYPDDRDRGISTGESFKNYIKTQIESLLNEDLSQERQLRRDNENGGSKLQNVKIADIVFAFNNSELIQLLRLRGGHIMYQRFDKMREVEKQISELKNSKFHDLTRPVGAFITFEEEDAYNLAQKYAPEYSYTGKLLPAKTQFLDTDFFLIKATEPTNIIWENRHFTNSERFKRSLQVIAIIFILVVISFAIIFAFKSYPIWVNKTWKNVDCDDINKAFSPDNEKYAVKEWTARFHDELSEEEVRNFQMTGALKCYCTDKLSELGYGGASKFIATGTDHEICKEFVADKVSSLFGNQMASNSIIVINYVLRLIIIKLIAYIGQDTESAQTKLVTNGVFLVQFFNTGILLLLVNGNLTEQSSVLGAIINGSLTDFNSLWFTDIGSTIVGAMIFNTYWPLFEFFAFWGMRTGFRMLDRGICSCNEYKTKKTTLQQYVEIYSGPTYFIHYKYSSILNITFVTFMYGLGIPILFPVACISLFTLYMVEKSMIYFSYRQPPLYDDLLNTNALNILSWAPLLFLSFGWWMFSSPQLFGNTIDPIDFSNEPRKALHYWYDAFSSNGYKASPALPLIICFWIFLFLQLFKSKIMSCLVACSPSFFKVGELELDEDIDNYYKCLDDDDREWSIKEEENCRKVLGMKILGDDTIASLKSNTMGKGHLQGIHTYDILRNNLYLDDFQYFSAAREDREKFIIDDDDDEENDNAQSDLVRVILNLAFLHEDKAKIFSFSKDAYKNVRISAFGGLLTKAKIQ